MPFKSEKQRRYLWANEPEIARDWTDTYGHKARGADGGVMRVPFAEAGGVGTLTADEISDLESMVQTFPDTKGAKDAQRKLDINAGKTVETEEIPWYQKMLGFGKAEGAELGSPAEDQAQKEFFDYGTQQADIGDTAYSNLKVPGLDVKYPKGIETIDKSEFIDDANYIPKWNEYTSDPEYDEEEGKDYPVDQPKKGFGDAKTLQEYFANNPQFYQGIAQNLGRGIGKTRDTARNIYQGGKRRGMQGLNLLGAAYQGAKRAFPISLLFGGLKSAFSQPYLPATSRAGGYSIAQQNQMNALGGYYSEPARQQRRNEARIANMEQRAREGKPISQENYNQLTMGKGPPGQYSLPQPTGGEGALQDRGPGGQTPGQRETQRAQRDDPGLGGHKKGGRVRFLEGGLASLWI
jgi:hypothetical protein